MAHILSYKYRHALQKQASLILAGGVIALLALQSIVLGRDDETDFFESKIRSILVERCYGCHSLEKGKTQGGLALDSQAGWQKGGDSGPTIVPGKVDESLIIQAIEYRAPALQMPPEESGGKIADAEIQLLREWVARGAHDPRVHSAKKGGLTEQEIRNWWSFQPLLSSFDANDSIDGFIERSLKAANLTPSQEADRRSLIRRATYDLTGVPPTAEEVTAFVSDNSPNAYDALIERLLQSPRYGERWGRHWLDLVRYADTAGENTDHPIPDAWRYRNWVIDAFNRDLPYDQFIREQIAGDLLHANDSPEQYANGIISTGYLAMARRFDHDIDKFTHLTIEDTIDTTGKTILGLTIACARCHDHKYDPITIADYYGVYGILSSTRYSFPGCEAKQQPRDMVPLVSDEEWARRVEPYEKPIREIDAKLASGKQVDLKSDLLDAKNVAELATGKIPDGGSQLFSEQTESRLAVVEVKKGQVIQLSIDPTGDYGADSTLLELEIAESNSPDKESRVWNLTTDLLSDGMASNPHADRYGNVRTWLMLDGRSAFSLLPERVAELSGKPGLIAWRNGENPAVFANTTDAPISVWTTLPAKTLFAHPSPTGAVAVAWLSPIDGRVAIKGQIKDAHPGGNNGVGWRIDHFLGDVASSLQSMLDLVEQSNLLARERAEYAAKIPPREFAYAAIDGNVANAKMHLRGDPEKLGEEVPRRWMELFGAEKVSAESGSGRLQLAKWLSDPANPLVSRVMVNRIWQYHFGKGIVATPSDFGTRGVPPSNPQLLDWLAVRFIESGWSIKSMHRLIMHSDSYRRSIGEPSLPGHADAMAVDPNNNLNWRFDRRRLSAEEIRDSLMIASQQLDWTPGSSHPIPPPSTWGFTQHGPFASVYDTDKRSIYMMTLRNRRHPFMGLFDGADPNATTPLRQVTTVPTQSLYFMNDAFFHAQAEKVAKRVLTYSNAVERLDTLFQIALQRLPTEREKEAALKFVADYTSYAQSDPTTDKTLVAWSALSRVMLSSNEFLYLD